MAPTPVSLPGGPMDGAAWRAPVPGVAELEATEHRVWEHQDGRNAGALGCSGGHRASLAFLSLPGELGHLPTQSAAQVLDSPPRRISWAFLLRATTFTPCNAFHVPATPQLLREGLWPSAPQHSAALLCGGLYPGPPTQRLLASPQT